MSGSENEIDFYNPTHQPSSSSSHITGIKLLSKEKNKIKKKQQNKTTKTTVATTTTTTKKSNKKIKKIKKQQQNLNDSGAVLNDDTQQLNDLTDMLNIDEINDTVRWFSNNFENVDDEENRLKIYKINRRKRYIEQRNRILNLTTTTSMTASTYRSNTDSAISSLSSNSNQ
jgi:hypothetical protein